MPGKKIPESRRREQILKAAYRVALRKKISGLSTRDVAAEAGISNGLVFFHFRNRRELMLALLDWMLTETILERAVDQDLAAGNASLRLANQIQKAVKGLATDRERIELFFDYWFMGGHDDAIRDRIRTALHHYRDSYVPLARAVIAEQPSRYAKFSGETLAYMVTAFIEGCAMRLILEPGHYNAKSYSEAISAMLSHPGSVR